MKLNPLDKKKSPQRTLTTAKKAAWDVFSLWARMRDCLLSTGSAEYGECITCDFSGHISQLDAGHFIPKHNANLFSERGVHTQCRKCNRFRSGEQLEYRRQVVRLYGEGADIELEKEAREHKKYTLQELESIRQKYKEKIKGYEVSNNIC